MFLLLMYFFSTVGCSVPHPTRRFISSILSTYTYSTTVLHLSEDSFSVDHYCNCFSTVFVQETGVYRQILSLGTVSNYKNTQFLRRPAPSVTKNDISRIKRGRSAGVKETGNKILKNLKKYISKIKINKRKPFFGHFGSKKTYLVMVATSLVMVATSLVMVATSLVMAVQFNHLSNHE